MPSQTEVDNFQQLIGSVSGKALVAVTALWAQYANADPQQRWQAMQDAYPELIDPYLAAAAVISAEWYSSLDPGAGFAVETAPPVERDVLQANMRWALTQTEPLPNLTGAVERQVFNSSRETILSNAKREGVRYARYASANACSFCQILATRTTTDLYATEFSAVRVVGRAGRPRGTRKLGEKFHDNCHCVPVAIRDGVTYEPPSWVAQWDTAYGNARNDVGGDTNDIINHMRRGEYPDRKDALNARRRELYAQNKTQQDQQNS